jgi:methionine--tRNA ligase beta chain
MNMLSFEEFQNVELKVGKVMEAARVEGSEKLLKLGVDLGGKDESGIPTLRPIVAGIGKVYEPEILIGREIVVVANLEHKRLMGLESQGMLLAASDENGPALLVPDREVPPGADVR